MANSLSLLPREHGAYAELAFPLATGLALVPPHLASVALAVSAILIFLGHEPLAILLGARGNRLRRQQGARAKVAAIVLFGAGALIGGFGVLAAWPRVWPSILYPMGILLALVPLLLRRREKTLAGELLVVAVFASVVFPLGAASFADPERVISAAALWWASFSLGTLEVHAIKARHRKRQRNQWTRWGSPLASAVAALLCCGLVIFSGDPYRWAALALLPPAVAIVVLATLRLSPRHLKRAGWTLVAANAAALFILLLLG